MSKQLPGTAMLEQILRAMELLGRQDAAVAAELAVLTNWMGAGAFQPVGLEDASGNPITLDMTDNRWGDPAGWLIPPNFGRVQVTNRIRPGIGPYPVLEILPVGGGFETSARGVPALVDQGSAVGLMYRIRAVVTAAGDQPGAAASRARVMCQAYTRLVRRTDDLGGLVHRVNVAGPPNDGGEVEQEKLPNLAGCMQEFSIYVEDSLE